MDDVFERELKLDVPPRFSLARLGTQLDAYLAAPVALARLHAVAYDAPDLRLTRWGVRLRYRRPGGWHLTLPPAYGGAPPGEHAFAGGPETVPAAALSLAAAYLRGATPVAVAELRILRTTRHVASYDGRELAALVEDDVRVIAGRRVINRFRRVDIELAPEAPDELLSTLAGRLQDEGAGPPDPTPDEVLVFGPRAAEPPLAVPAIVPDACVGDLFRAAVGAALEKFVRADPAIRWGGDDPEPVHQARVATRRLRSHLRTFAPVLDPGWAAALHDELGTLAAALGAARDADVLLERLGALTAALPEPDRAGIAAVLAPLRAERARAYAELRETLHAARYVALLDALVAAAEQPPLVGPADGPASDALATIMPSVWRKLRKAVRRRDRPPTDAQLHRIRVKAKRVRYAAEAFAPTAGRPAQGFAACVEALQTVLGDQHDAVVAIERLRERASDVTCAFTAGELAALEHAAAQTGRRRWRKAWRATKRRRLRFW